VGLYLHGNDLLRFLYILNNGKMDNLKLIKQVVLQRSDLIADVRCLTVDPLVGIIWVATAKAVYSISVEDNEVSCLAKCLILSYFTQIEPIGCLHKADSSKFIVNCDGITADAEIVILDSVSSIDSVCIAVNTGEVLLLHTSPHEVYIVNITTVTCIVLLCV